MAIPLWDRVRSLLPGRSGPPAPRRPQYAELLSELSGAGDEPEILRPLLLKFEGEAPDAAKDDILCRLLEAHPRPHLVNYLLAREEMSRGAEVVRSYPCNVWMDLSSSCNVECRFCKYTFQLLPHVKLTLEQIRAIEWLPYVRLLNLSAGTGESLTNPRFIEIFDHIREVGPHLSISLLSNGKALKEDVLRALRGRLDQLHVSMNAADEADHRRVFKHGDWGAFKANMAAMRRIFAGADRPRLTASFVMMRWNVERAVECLEFAAEYGANLVLFHHYFTPYIQEIHQDDRDTLADKFPVEESLYHDREHADEVFQRVRERARELGVAVQVPPPFSEKAHVAWGGRSVDAPSADCDAPWMNLYLLWGVRSKREEVTICCGLASDIGVYFDRDALATRQGLMEVWNSPAIRAYRRTVNGDRINPICALCRKTDRFDPAAPAVDQRTFFTFNGLPVPAHFQ